MWLIYLLAIGFLGALLSLIIQFNSSKQQNKSSPTPEEPDMAHSIAHDVLGLQRGARKREILMAHRRLIRHMHPDRGGSEYLASQINQAKDTLLKHSHHRKQGI